MKVIKRDGRIVDYDLSFIKKAIEKAYIEVRGKINLDITEVAYDVEVKIIEKYKDQNINIEEIQDIVESELMNHNLQDVAKAYILYRQRRSDRRQSNSVLSKTIAELAFGNSEDNDDKRENANINADAPMGAMLKVGSTIMKEFTLSRVMKPKHAELHRRGVWHENDLDLGVWCWNCLLIPLGKLLKRGFSTGHGSIRPPSTIGSASTLTCIIIQSAQNDQFGGQSIPNLDWDLGVFVAKSFIRNIVNYADIKHMINKTFEQLKKDFIKPMDEYLTNQEYGRIINEKGKEIIRKYFKDIPHYEFDNMWNYALEKTDKDTYQAMESMIHNLCTLASRAGSQVPFSSVNVGLDTSEEGRMITKNLFLAQDAGLGSGETAIFPISVMRMKKGITDPGSINYDLFKLSCKTSAKRLFPNYVSLDCPINLKYYHENKPDTHVSSMGMVADGIVYIRYTNYNMDLRYKMNISKLGLWLLDNVPGTKLTQFDDYTLYVDNISNIEIYDNILKDFTPLRKWMKSSDPNRKWYKIQFKQLSLTLDDNCNPICVNHESLIVSDDHPFPLIDIDNFYNDLKRIKVSDIYKYLSNGDNTFNYGFIGLSEDIPHENNIIALDWMRELSEDEIKSYELYSIGGYDVETESDRFMINGICSHNCRTRVIANNFDSSREIGVSRGNICMLNMNLPYIALEVKRENPDISKTELINKFYVILNKYMDEAKDRLYDRFEFLGKREAFHFPFAIGQGLYLDSEKLLPTDPIRSVISHGTLVIGFIGLAEALIALTGEHHGESDESQEVGLSILKMMNEKTVEYSKETGLTFGIMGSPAEGATGRLMKCIKKEFGIIPKISDKDFITNSHHIPVDFPISAWKKARIEAPYHSLEPSGHISYIELDANASQNLEAFEKLVLYMAECGMGYFSINHPVDRDPVCGYVGVIGDTCPRCGRREGEGVPAEKLLSLLAYQPDPIYAVRSSMIEEEESIIPNSIDLNSNEKD